MGYNANNSTNFKKLILRRYLDAKCATSFPGRIS
nr:MAG TPA: hypothetical protein [Caudoviricetes sp.]